MTTLYYGINGTILNIGGTSTTNCNISFQDTGITAYDSVPWYSQRNDIVTVNFVNSLSPSVTKFWFYGFNKLAKINNMQYLVTQYITDMSYMFYNCSNNFFNPDLSKWNVSNVTNMSYMFYGCSGYYFNPDLLKWNVSNVTNMSYMFRGCSGSIFNPNLSEWNVSNVTDMSNMFLYCNGPVFNPDLSKWNVSNVTNMSNMFQYCNGKSFTELKLDTWIINSNAVISYMFASCYNLKTIYCNNDWENSNTYVFYSCRNLSGPYHTDATASYTGEYARPDTEEQRGYFTKSGIYWGYDSNTKTLHLSQKYSSDNPNVFNEETIIGENDIPWKNNRTDIKIVQINGNIRPLTIAFWFTGFENWTVTNNWKGLDVSRVTNMNNTFKSCSRFNEDVSNWDTSNVTNMDWTFQYCARASFNPDVSKWNTSNVTSMAGMFNSCSGNSFNPDVSNWDTSNVTNMSYMFSWCPHLTSLNLSNFNTSNVTNMSYMFKSSANLQKIYVSNLWDTQNVTSSTEMFNGCTSLIGQRNTVYNSSYIDKTYARIDRPNTLGYLWNQTDGIAYAVYDGTNTLTFFRSYNIYTNDTSYSSIEDICGNLYSGIVYNKIENYTSYPWDHNICNTITIVTFAEDQIIQPASTKSWFSDYLDLIRIDNIKNLDTSNVEDMSEMFNNCNSLTSLDLSNFNTSNVTDMMYMFSNCVNLTSLNVSSFDTSNVTDMQDMFDNCEKLSLLNLSNFNTSKVTNMKDMFYGCSRLSLLNISNFDTFNVTTMRRMFYYCDSLTSLDLSNFNTLNVENMAQMFRGCLSLTSLNVSNFDTSNVTDMQYMFYGCLSLTSLNVSNFDTSKVTNMSSMFFNCSSLVSLDLFDFDTSNVTDMPSMFNSCFSLEKIYVSNLWNVENVTSSTNMFLGCSSLIGQKGTVYNSSYKDKTYAHIDEGTSNPGYLSDSCIKTNKIKFKDENSSTNWTSILDMLYPIGSILLWNSVELTPAQTYGGRWTNITSEYQDRYLALTESQPALGGKSLFLSWMPKGIVGDVILTPAMCTAALNDAPPWRRELTSNADDVTSTYTWNHTHTFSAGVAKSISTTTTSPVKKKSTAYGQNYTRLVAAAGDTTTLDHHTMSSSTNWIATYQAHTHTYPDLAAANATTAHNHTYYGEEQYLNLNPKGYGIILWRRDG